MNWKVEKVRRVPKTCTRGCGIFATPCELGTQQERPLKPTGVEWTNQRAMVRFLAARYFKP